MVELIHEVEDVDACLELCKVEKDCEYFTFFEVDNSCLMLANCVTFSTDTCTDCYSGDRNCEGNCSV